VLLLRGRRRLEPLLTEWGPERLTAVGREDRDE
jgi:hypothetical protein